MDSGHDVRERVLAIVRAALLNDSIKVDDNLFEVGGDSLTFLEICSEIEDEFEIEIPLDAAWAAANLAEFLSVVEGCLASSGGQPLASGR